MKLLIELILNRVAMCDASVTKPIIKNLKFCFYSKFYPGFNKFVFYSTEKELTKRMFYDKVNIYQHTEEIRVFLKVELKDFYWQFIFGFFISQIIS